MPDAALIEVNGRGDPIGSPGPLSVDQAAIAVASLADRRPDRPEDAHAQ